MKRSVAIIPARSGSKRLPGKNVKVFHGQPVIAYSIKAAVESKLFERVIVSTDSEEFKAIAESMGAEVPFIRPANLADDYTPIPDVFCHALDWLKHQGETYDDACLILATAPFIQVDHLKDTYKLLKNNSDDIDGVVPVTSFSYPIMRSLKLEPNKILKMNWPEHEFTRSNDLEEAYHDVGQFYWVNVQRFFKAEKKRLLLDNYLGYPIPRHLVQDIDTPEDWDRAELIYKALFNN